MTDDETNLTSLLGSVSSAHYVGDEEVLSGGKGGREGGREGEGREGGREGEGREGGKGRREKGGREGGLTSEDTKKRKTFMSEVNTFNTMEGLISA